MPDYILEYAKSSQSKCRTCYRAIAEKSLRLGTYFEPPEWNVESYNSKNADGGYYRFQHWGCVGARQLSLMLSMDGMPRGWHGLEKVDKKKVHEAIERGWVEDGDWRGVKGENRKGVAKKKIAAWEKAQQAGNGGEGEEEEEGEDKEEGGSDEEEAQDVPPKKTKKPAKKAAAKPTTSISEKPKPKPKRTTRKPVTDVEEPQPEPKAKAAAAPRKRKAAEPLAPAVAPPPVQAAPFKRMTRNSRKADVDGDTVGALEDGVGALKV